MNHDFLQRIVRCIDEGHLDELKDAIRELQPTELAELIDSLHEETQAFTLFDCTPDQEIKSETLLHMSERSLETFIDYLNPDDVAQLLSVLAPDDAADLINRIELHERTPAILRILDPDLHRQLNELLAFDEETAGGIMTSELLAFPGSITVGDVQKIITKMQTHDPIMYVYVLDSRTRRFIGVVPLVKFISDNTGVRLDAIAEKVTIWAQVDEDREEIMRKFRTHNLWVMPVLDDKGHLVGRITLDDVLNVSVEEAEEDLAKVTGTPDLIVGEEGFVKIARLRIPWLLITLGLAIINVFVIGHLLKTVNNVIALSIFPPLIAAMSGNTGMQSATIFIREIAINNILPESYRHISLRETLTGLLMGICCGSIAFLATFSFLSFSDIPMGSLNAMSIGIIVFFAIVSGMTFASLFGTICPMLLKRYGYDPAVSAGPFVTTMNDIVSSVIYFCTANLLILWIH